MSVRSYRPASDHDPEGAKRANYLGTRNMVDAAEAMGEKQPKFVHISTVALYGHRNHLHPWAGWAILCCRACTTCTRRAS